MDDARTAAQALARPEPGSGAGATAAPDEGGVAALRPSDVLRRARPGPVFRVVKAASWIELGLFAILLVVWLGPGMEHETFYAGLAHGIGFIVLALLIWVAVLRREAPYTLLAATLTPVGPVGSVIAIEWIERRERRSRAGHGASREAGSAVDRRDREVQNGAQPQQGVE